MTFIWGIIKWRIVRGAKQAGKDEQRLKEMESQAADYRSINEIVRKEDEQMYQRLEGDLGDDDSGNVDWVPDRRGKSRK